MFRINHDAAEGQRAIRSIPAPFLMLLKHFFLFERPTGRSLFFCFLVFLASSLLVAPTQFVSSSASFRLLIKLFTPVHPGTGAHPDPGAVLSVEGSYKTAAGSAYYVEEKAISVGVYYGNIGGNLGVFFGFCVIAVLHRLVDIAVTIRERRLQKRCRKGIKNAFVAASYILCISVMVAEMEEVSTAFFDRKTSSLLLENNDDFKLPLVIARPAWVSNIKIRRVFNVTEDFWENEAKYSIPINMPGSQVYMCELIQSLYIANPVHPPATFDTSRLQAVLNQQPGLQNKGIVSFSKDLAFDGVDVVKNVTDGQNNLIPYNVQKIATLMGISYKVDLFQNDTRFSHNLNGINLWLPMNLDTGMDSGLHCGHNGVITALFDDAGEFGFSSTYHTFVFDLHHVIKISRQSGRFKTRPNRPCLLANQYDPNCVFKCLRRHIPCFCEALMPEQDTPTGYPFVRNVTTLCNYLQEQHTQCPMVRLMNSKVLKLCDQECVMPCKSNTYVIETTSVKKEILDNFVKLNIIYERQIRDLSVEEFYVFDIVSLLCTGCSFASLMFGISFISFWTGPYNAFTMLYSKIMYDCLGRY